MKTLSRQTLIAVMVTLLSAAFAQAQNRERFGISAQAGGVNAVSGEVVMKRQGHEPKLITSQDDLISGDIVNTHIGSQAEILLNPGTYLRLAENSELVLVDNSLDHLLVKLNRGSAIIEATGPDGVEQHIPVVTAQERLTILRAGIYRINAMPGATELLVQKGRVKLGNDPKNIVKGGKKLTIRGSSPQIVKLTKEDRDDFDVWSKDRGKTLARANTKISARTLSGLSRSTYGMSAFRSGRWGFWTWSASVGCYTFYPFYYGWSSPYGNWYSSYAGWGGYYGGYYNQNAITGNTGNSGYTGSGSAPGNGTGIAAPPPMTLSEVKSAPPQSMPAPPQSMPAPPPQPSSEGRIKTPDKNN